MTTETVRGPSTGELAWAWRRDLVTALIGVWLIGGVVSDAWAHFNVPSLESFFTPWHGVLYAGLAAMAGWLALIGWRGLRAGLPPREALPSGYRTGAAGVVLFGLGGMADLAWHQLFGIEVAVDALLSPSHLVLLVGGLLILSTALRSQWTVTPPGRGSVPAMLSLISVIALVTFFALYGSAFAMDAATSAFVPTPEGTPGHLEAEVPVNYALSAYLITTALFTVPVLLTIRAGRRRPLTVTAVVATVAVFPVTVLNGPITLAAAAGGSMVGALLGDVVLARLRPEAHPIQVPVLAGLVAALVWSGQLIGLAMADTIRWPAELVSGVVVVSALTAAGLGLLVVPMAGSRRASTNAP